MARSSSGERERKEKGVPEVEDSPLAIFGKPMNRS